MRRVVDYQMLMFAVVALCMVGCSSSPPPDVADAGNATETRVDVALSDPPESVDLKAVKSVEVAPREATPEKRPAPAEIADGADSDEPNSYQPHDAGEAGNAPRLASQPPNPEAAGIEATEGNVRSDGDDPAAALVLPQVAEQQDEEPLNNGREPTARPIPEGQRVAVALQEDAAEPVEAGRTPNAEPGAQVASPVKASPTTKPVAASRKTLSDLPKSIQGLDKDGDGQLGVYEWPREKLAEFKSLDANKDGFLTPSELVAGQKKPSDAEALKGDKQPAAGGDEKAEEKAATKTDDGSQKDEAKASATDAATDGADSEDDSSADDQPQQGS